MHPIVFHMAEEHKNYINTGSVISTENTALCLQGGYSSLIDNINFAVLN